MRLDTYKHKLKITWIGGYIKEWKCFQATAESKYGHVFLDIFKLNKHHWEVQISDADTEDFIDTWIINDSQLRNMLMYVQVNKHSEDSAYMEGEVYSVGDNAKICEFKWTLSEGTVWTSPQGLQATNIGDLIDDHCSSMYYEDTSHAENYEL